jgi:hypothetical protein
VQGGIVQKNNKLENLDDQILGCPEQFTPFIFNKKTQYTAQL